MAPAVAASLPAEAASANVISRLPSAKIARMAWTVDDGAMAESVAAYLKFASSHWVKLNLFITSGFAGWKPNEPEIKRLLKAGLLQLGNHTTTHKNLTTLSFRQVQTEILNCHRYIEDAFGLDARPYFRPPYGAYNSNVISAAADLGYTKVVVWNGSLVDTSSHPKGSRLIFHANQSMKDGRIVLSHANKMAVPNIFPQLYEIMRSRGLNLVKLNEVF